jgi:HlyD family secretion protein
MKGSGFRPLFLAIGAVAVIAALAFAGWSVLQPKGPPPGFASGNGRIEATEIDIAAKIPGRLAEVLVREGEFVRTGQPLARMDTATLDAQLKEAIATLRRAEIGVTSAQSLVTQREAEKSAAHATIDQRRAEMDAAAKRLARTENLTAAGHNSPQKRDDDRAQFLATRAGVSAAEANLAAAEAAVATAKSGVIAAQAQVEATQATIQRIQADIDDTILRAPRHGRVQYRVAQPGEVLAAGGIVLNMVDLAEVYMTFFLGTSQAGRVGIGSEARIVLDAAPQYVIPASVTFVADVAQFTPKTVETTEERQKLTFRVKATIPADLLRKYIEHVKTGLPGVTYVRIDAAVPWPTQLQERLPRD